MQTTLPNSLSDSGWTLSDDGKSIHKTFKFSDFRAAMAFMLAVSYEAEAIDHHPNWLNVYNRVEVKLTTHVGDRLTDKDIALASFMDSVV